MGIVISYQPDEGSPASEYPWLVTFQPSDDADDAEEWDSFSCGPYQREHAEALAEAVALATEGITAIVEPVIPALDVQSVLTTIEEKRAEAEHDDTLTDDDLDEDDDDDEPDVEADLPVPTADEVRDGIKAAMDRLRGHLG